MPPLHHLRPAALLAAIGLATAGMAAPAHAQTADDRFVVRLSAFNPEAELGIAGNGSVTDGSDVATFEFDERFDTSRSWRPRGAVGFRFSDRQALVANYYDYRRNETWEYGGTVLDAGSIGAPAESIEVPEARIDGRLGLSLASLNYEYSFISNDTLQWGLGLGVTWAELELRAAGSSGTTDLVDDLETVEWKRSGFSPGLHTRLTWMPAERWTVGLEGQYLNTSWGDFLDEDGHFERAGLFVEYMVSPRVGVHVGYDWFRLKLADDFTGTARAPDGIDAGPFPYDGRVTGDLRVHGPMAGLSFRF
ncbi:hypothetical protein WCE55_10915 [Luteimonas sp. MJ293]|uniref:hypothetical protein n=1 Tax=Luteimonas sp. MJ146 TaxID=3129240 RepID=UPI0031B9BA12